MEIRYVTGDLLEAAESHILHGCNNRGGFRSGVAGLIRAKYPSAYEAYNDQFRTVGLPLGSIHCADAGSKTIINGITQDGFGRDGKRYVVYEAVRSVMRAVNLLSQEREFDSVAMPLIGAGLGGGEWATIKGIIEFECAVVQPVVYLLDGVVPA